MRELVDETVAEAAAAASAAGRDVRWEVRVDPPELRFRVDRVRISQVLANLLDNAVQHTPPGTVVWVRASSAALRGEVVIDVVDSGAGIPPADRERVFERFQRGNSPALTGRTSTGGTGLGLAISRWAVTIHGGTIQVVDSLAGEGATVRMRLPVRGPRGPRTVGTMQSPG